ncbi:MAG: LLM class flavin-dependent oxidoreductase [Caulobacteraceae bacterium]|nr:LLM class flavin-dependent oxidoreductase [Caulobacteraceae bacterium]
MQSSTDPGAGDGDHAPLLLGLALDALAAPASSSGGERDAYLALARKAEAAGFDLVLAGYAAAPAERLDALSLAAAMTTATRTLGLCAVVETAGWAPYNLARAFASFDLLAGGRTGWFAVPGQDEPADPGFERFAEHLEVVFALFDSWDDDALVFDKAAAVFADRDRTRRIRHHGRFFTVDGPLNAPRPPQGRPVILQHVGDGAPKAALADVAVSRAATPEAAAAARAGLNGAPMIVDLAVSLAGAPLETDRLAWRGPAAGLVALIEAWARSGAADGFNILPASPAADLEVLAAEVLPALKARGLMRSAPASGDLRTRLGLPRPANRYAPVGEGVPA